MSDAPEGEIVIEEPGEDLSARVDELEQKLRDTEARLRTVSKAYADQKGEMASFRERVESQDKVRIERKEFEVLSLFLDPVEDLKRSIEAGAGDVEALFVGLRMVHQRFADAMSKLGMRAIPGLGSVFDPTVHDAIGTLVVADDVPEGQVVAVAQEGYLHGSKVLRAARVLVGRRAPSPAVAAVPAPPDESEA